MVLIPTQPTHRTPDPTSDPPPYTDASFILPANSICYGTIAQDDSGENERGRFRNELRHYPGAEKFLAAVAFVVTGIMLVAVFHVIDWLASGGAQTHACGPLSFGGCHDGW